MIIACSVHLGTFLPHPRRKIDLTADDGVNTLGLCLLIKSYGTVHNAVVGNGDRIHPKFLRAPDEFLDPTRAIQQTILRMHVEMGKGHSLPPFLLSSSLVTQRILMHKTFPRSPGIQTPIPPYTPVHPSNVNVSYSHAAPYDMPQAASVPLPAERHDVRS